MYVYKTINKKKGLQQFYIYLQRQTKQIQILNANYIQEMKIILRYLRTLIGVSVYSAFKSNDIENKMCVANT